MTEDTRITDIQNNIYTLHERSQKTKSELETHEAICSLRYQILEEKLDKLNSMIEINNKQIADLHRIATEGRVGFKTTMIIGTFVTAVAGFVYTLLSIYRG